MMRGKAARAATAHGSVTGVTITLWAETGGEREQLQTWTKDGGRVIQREALTAVVCTSGTPVQA